MLLGERYHPGPYGRRGLKIRQLRLGSYASTSKPGASADLQKKQAPFARGARRLHCQLRRSDSMSSRRTGCHHAGPRTARPQAQSDDSLYNVCRGRPHGAGTFAPFQRTGVSQNKPYRQASRGWPFYIQSTSPLAISLRSTRGGADASVRSHRGCMKRGWMRRFFRYMWRTGNTRRGTSAQERRGIGHPTGDKRHKRLPTLHMGSKGCGLVQSGACCSGVCSSPRTRNEAKDQAEGTGRQDFWSERRVVWNAFWERFVVGKA